MIDKLRRRFALPLALLCGALLAFAAPYLLPDGPDSEVFRESMISLLLALAVAFPAEKALRTLRMRELLYGIAYGLIFACFLSFGSEMQAYGRLLPGMSAMLRRVAVPLMAAPSLGLLAAHAFAFEWKTEKSSRIRLPFLAYFLPLALCYTAVLLADWPGVISYDFEHEIRQFSAGVFEAAHPVFHTLLLGSIYRIGEMLFGSMTAGAALYSVFQLLLMAAAFAEICLFVQRRLPTVFALIVAAFFALFPPHGVMAISTAKDPLFAALVALLCLSLWEVAENPAAFAESRKKQLRFVVLCVGTALLRHNALFAFLPACIALPFLLPKKNTALLLAALTLALSFGLPRGLQLLVHAQSAPSSEMMSVPCQQLMRTAEVGEISSEEYAELNEWFSGVTFRYRPHCADPAKGGNFDFARYQQNPSAFWQMWLRYGLKCPRVYLEAFLANSQSLWAPGDTSFAHALSMEDGDYITMNLTYPFAEERYPITPGSYFPQLMNVLFEFTHNSRWENVPLLSQLCVPATWSLAMLFALMRLCCKRRARLAASLLPLLFVCVSLFFAAGIFLRYAYPLMAAMPALLLMVLRTGEKT